MTREGRRSRLVLATLAAGAVLLSGCTSGAEPSAAARGGDEPSSSPSSEATTTVDASPSSTPAVPEPGSMAEPATSSGPLRQSSFPTPRQLGPGWRYAIDPGDAEEGYAGNGTPALARNPREIVQTVVPFGCDARAALPEPTHALEVDYTVREARVVAVRVKFAGDGQAQRFFVAREANLRGCLGRAPSQAIGPLVASLRRPAEDATASERTPESDPYRELAVLDGDAVVLVAVRGTDVLTAAETRRLVRLFRSSTEGSP